MRALIKNSKKIVLNQVSNPGISFTKDVNEKILALYITIYKLLLHIKQKGHRKL